MAILFRLLLVTFSFLTATSIGGCTRFAEIATTEPFEGVKQALARDSAVSIFIAHGMSGYSEGDPDRLVNNLVKTMNLRQSGPMCVRTIERESPFKHFGSLVCTEYTDPATTQAVRIYTLDWRGTTWNEKATMRVMDEDAVSQGQRSQMIRDLKEHFANSGLGDASLFAGRYAPEMRVPFEQSLRWIYDDTRGYEKHELVVITFSLGSSILIDTFDHMTALYDQDDSDPGALKVAKACIGELSGFFMLSNQLPLFQLSRMEAPDAPYNYNRDTESCIPTDYWDANVALEEGTNRKGWEWEKSSLGRFVFQKRKSSPDFHIVAVTDPNDLLSYAVKDCCMVGPDGKMDSVFINAKVRNVKTAYCGLVDPMAAHGGYSANKAVIQFITGGNTVD